MKKIFLITVCCAMLFAMSPVAYSFDFDGMYVGGSIGYSQINDMNLENRLQFQFHHKDLEPDGGFALSVAAGFRPYEMLRVEGEMSYQTNDIDNQGLVTINGDVSSFALMLNGYFEPAAANGSPFQPYITFGIGWVNVESDFTLTEEPQYAPLNRTFKYDTAQGAFGYQVGAGVGYAYSEKITFDFKYRYQWADKLAYNSTVVEYTSNNIYVGIRYAF